MGTVHAKEAGISQPGMMEPDDSRDVNLAKIPVKVERIHIDGLGRTKNDIVASQLKDVFQAANFEELVHRAEAARQRMERLGLFKKASVFIDTSQGENARPDGYELTYTVKETRRVLGGANGLMGTNDASVGFQIKLPNVFGRAEQFVADYTRSYTNTIGYGASFFKPLGGNPNLTVKAGAYRSAGDYVWSGYRELDRGVSLDFNFPSIFGNHTLRWDGVWRELSCMDNMTAFAVREQAGHTVKSALTHTWQKDTRDDRVLPNNGYLVKVSQELAGLGGDAKFYKHDVELSASKSLILDTVVQASLAGGIMKSLVMDEPVKICDKFFIGGPLTLRGFNFKGCGPSEDGAALGGEAYWLAGLHLYTPLPFRPGRGGFGDLFRTHFFLNAGNLHNVDYSSFGDSGLEGLKGSLSSMRWSYGAGVVLKMGGVARIELNYVKPVAQHGDSVNKGMQFGIGVNFL